jgi:hypothetical protein
MRFNNYLNEQKVLDIGQRVEGKYIDGSKYVGSIQSRRFHSYNSWQLIYTIILDKPYKGKDIIMISIDTRTNKGMNDAEIKPSNKKLSKSVSNSQKKRELDKLYKMLDEIPKVFGTGPKADSARKEIEDDIKKLKGK